jgi:hypothetical protein
MQMSLVRTIFRIILLISAILLGLALLAGLIVLAAYGLGLLLNLLLHFQTFEAVLLSLLALGVVLIIMAQILTSSNPLRSAPLYDDEDDEWDEWDEDDDEEEDEISQPIVYPGIPRWRQPLKNVDFSNTKPDDRCPCGSGRKYKNCHGAKNAAR